MLNKYFPVLDHGFIALKDIMGGDEDIEQAARVSYGKGTRKSSETRGLIRYLLRHKHTSPLEMVETKWHVRVPCYVWRQWIRHRTANVNELSMRYSEALDFCEQTQPDKWRLQSTGNKQGSGSLIGNGAWLSLDEEQVQTIAVETYKRRLKNGVAREQARKDLPLSTYTEAYWKIDLHNLLHFLNLRCDSHAQLEIRSYANVIAGIIKECCPLTFEAWEDYTFGAITFSRQEMMVLRDILSGRRAMQYNSNVRENCKKYDMNNREVDEFISKLDKDPRIFDIVLPEPKPYEHFQEEQHEKNNQVGKSTS